MWKQRGGPIAPNFTYSATALTQALDPQCQAKAQRDHVAEEWRSAAEGKPQAGPGTPGEYILPRSSKPAEAKPQQNPKKKKKKPKYAHTQNTGTATGQRSPEAPALYGCTKPHQARTTPRHRQDGSRKGRGVSHFRYNCKRDIKEDGLR